MEKRSWRIARRNGFTAIETVVTVVVLAILAAYATPKLFGLKDQADATEETLKIKDIEARHTQEILNAGKRGSNPTLGDVVGFRPEVVAEPAPDTADVMVDWSFFVRFAVGTSTSFAAENLGIPMSYITSGSVTQWEDPNNDGLATCEELVSGGRGKLAWFSGGNSPSVKKGMGVLRPLEDDFVVESLGVSIGAPASAAPPQCRANRISVSRWRSTAAAGYQRHILDDIEQTEEYVSVLPQWESVTWQSPGITTTLKTIAPERYRFTCSPASEKYGTKYELKGHTAAQLHPDKDKSTWMGTTRSLVSLGTTPASYEQIAAVPTVGTRYCERVGPAPAVPPADPGNPGIYPMAADGSGYCLSPGRKLPTYRDGSGTPTSSASDSVVELATEAVDDPANCPG